MSANNKANKKQQKKKLIITVFAVGAAGVLGYFGWQYWKKKKGSRSSSEIKEISTSSDNDPDDILKPFTTSSTSISNNSSFINTTKPKKKTSFKAPSAGNSDFPLRKGSKGEKVRQLQEALIAKHGKGILPMYGADGDFGSEVASALKKIGLPASIDANTFNVLVQGTTTGSNSTPLGKVLWQAAFARNLEKVLDILRRMKNTEDYTVANEVFKQYRINGVRQTIVNGLLNVFTKTDQKEKIKYEFLRMGLQYDGKKWSLSGLDGIPIMTIVPATVWINAYKGVEVPARMVLGKEVCRRLDYTLFQNKGKYFLVNTKCVKHL